MLLTTFLFCFGMTAMAAPSVEGQTELKVSEGEVTTAEYTITSDEDMESVSINLSYDRDMLTYLSGSGGNNFSGNGGNGAVQLSSKPGAATASFTVNFRGKADGETTVEIVSCVITVDGKEIDGLTGEDLSEEEEPDDPDEDAEDSEDGERASWVIDERTFYLHNPGSLDGFDNMSMDIQGIRSRVLKHANMDLYVIKLHSDNGSYRDHFVYNPDTGNVIPFVEMKSGPDTVYFIEPDENVYVPTRYVRVELGWGPKYTIPAYKHVIIDGIDEIQDDTNRYLVYGINQDGEKAWYSFDYDKNTIQLFDDVAYQGEQNYILELETNVQGQKEESTHLRELYNKGMGRRLYIIMFMTIIIVVLLNIIVLMYLRMRKMTMPEDSENEDTTEMPGREPGECIVGNLEENETDFQEPEQKEETEQEEPELEIIDLDDSGEEEF